MKRKTIGAVSLVAVAVAAAAWYATRPDPVAVRLADVERGPVSATVSNTRAGTVKACSRARMAPILGGQIAALPVAEGDAVEAGQVLLELWNDDVAAQVNLAVQERLAAEARADESCTSANVSRREAQRIERLRKQGLSTEEEADIADGRARASAAACQAMRSMIEVSAARIVAAQAALERTVVRAPFAGTVAEINGEIGEVVTPSPVGIPTLPAVDLIDNSCIYVSAPIDEVDAPDIRAGMTARITLDAFADRVFPATVRRVAPYVLDIEKQARTVDIEAEFDEPSGVLLPGYSADVEVILAVSDNALRVPTRAVVGGNKVLILGDDGLLAEREVRTGLRNWEHTEILDGLQGDERIVLSIDRPGVVAGAAAVEE